MIFAVTGTDTEVGKTVVTATFAAAALEAGLRVAVYKPTQTGVGPEDEGDVQSVARWLNNPAALTTAEGARLAPAMAPVDALRHQTAHRYGPDGQALPTLQEHASAIRALAAEHDVVLVEGAGGLLVRLTEAGESIAELALAVQARPVVVTRPDLGTLNHTELTLEAANRRGLTDGVLIVGGWPQAPDALHQINRDNLIGLAERFGWRWAPGPARGIVAGEAAAVTAALHEAGRALLAAPGVLALP